MTVSVQASLGVKPVEMVYGYFWVNGYLKALGPSDSDGAISFLSRAAEPGAFGAKKPPIFIPKLACTCI